MSFTVVNVAQRSPEWHAARAGRLTSTGAADMLSTLKSGGESAARRNLRVRLALERVIGKPIEREYQSPSMRDGVARESAARAAYEALTGQIVSESGFLAHTELMAGASIDGHVGDLDRIVEIKCPIHATHLEYLTSGDVPLDYMRQIQHQLWITGAKYCDFFSFHPDFPEPLQAKLVEVWRNDDAIGLYEREARRFLSEVDRLVESIQTMANLPGQLRAAAESVGVA